MWTAFDQVGQKVHARNQVHFEGHVVTSSYPRLRAVVLSETKRRHGTYSARTRWKSWIGSEERFDVLDSFGDNNADELLQKPQSIISSSHFDPTFTSNSCP